MKSFRQIQSVFLILLLSGSFFLHTFVHHSDCCSGSHLSVRKDSVKRILLADCADVSIDVFCPVCAGMLNADQVPTESRLAIPFGRTVVFSAFSDLLSTPSWLLPSPRAPPAIISSHIG